MGVNLTGGTGGKVKPHGAYNAATGTTTTDLGGGVTVTGSPADRVFDPIKGWQSSGVGGSNFDFGAGGAGGAQNQLFSTNQGGNAKSDSAYLPAPPGYGGMASGSVAGTAGGNVAGTTDPYASLNRGQDLTLPDNVKNQDLSKLPGVPDWLVNLYNTNAGQLSSTLGKGPQNYFSPGTLSQIQQQALQLLQGQNRQAGAGMANANAARGIVGPSLDSVSGNLLDASARGVAANTGLNALVQGATLGNQAYANQVGAAQALGQLGQNAATLKEDELTKLWDIARQTFGIQGQAEENRQTSAQQNTEQIDRMVVDYLHQRGINEQQANFQNARDTLDSYLSMMTDPALLALKGNDADKLNRAKNILAGLFPQFFGAGTFGGSSTATPGTTIGGGHGLQGGETIQQPGSTPITPITRSVDQQIANQAGVDVNDLLHYDYGSTGIPGRANGSHNLLAGYESNAAGNIQGQWTMSNWANLRSLMNNNYGGVKDIYNAYVANWKRAHHNSNPPLNPLLDYLETEGIANFGGYRDPGGGLRGVNDSNSFKQALKDRGIQWPPPNHQ